MLLITRQMCHDAERADEPLFDQYPLQVGLAFSPWRTAVASMLLAQTQRKQMQSPLEALFSNWPTSDKLMDAHVDAIAMVLRPCGFQNRRARAIKSFLLEYWGEWHNLAELTGIGPYVHDAVALFCFGDMDIQTNDHALRLYVSWKTTNSTTPFTDFARSETHGKA